MRFMFCLLVTLPALCLGLDNGLALTPPMGWLSWERFRCNVDCTNDPDNCISEKLFKQMADHMAADGYKDAGYEYIIIDDCWLARNRSAGGQLQPDPERFPSGIKALADYIHGKGLKFGIYEDFGTHTCAGYPGSEYYLQMDAQTFASWGVDYLKLDGCNSNPDQYDDEYPPVAFWLNKTGRPITYSCEFPLYQEGHQKWPDFKRVAKACNLARNFQDIQDSWVSLTGIINFYGQYQGKFAAAAGPGFFNDPDMLIIGNFGLSWDQQRVQMALWSIMASPLIMSTDLRSIRAESKALLLNKYAIAINQDKLGKQGKLIKTLGNIQVWVRPILPQGSMAFAFVNFGTGGTPSKVSIKLSDIGLNSTAGYTLYEVFDNAKLGSFKPSDTFNATVNPTGVFFGHAVPNTSKSAATLDRLLHRFRMSKLQKL